MKVHINWQGKRAFEAKGSSLHNIIMDANPDFGGENRGARPMELLLMGLGGCSGIDVVAILEKMRLKVESLSIEVQGERADAHPARFTNIHVQYVIEGSELTPEKVERAIRLSQFKYCSAAASLNATMTASFLLNGQAYEISQGELTDEDDPLQ